MVDEQKNQKKEELREGLHTIADRVADGSKYVGTLLEKFASYSKKLVGEAYEAGKELHEDVQVSGGYLQAAKRIRTEISDLVSGAYKNVEESFFTDGEFDAEKAKKTLSDRKKAIERFGVRTYETFLELSNDCNVSVRRKLDQYIPSKEELKGRYAGIGTDYPGIYLRLNYDACLKFFEDVDSKMPKKVKYRKAILEDIKKSASRNKVELLTYYSSNMLNAGLFGSIDNLTLMKYIQAHKLIKEEAIKEEKY